MFKCYQKTFNHSVNFLKNSRFNFNASATVTPNKAISTKFHEIYVNELKKLNEHAAANVSQKYQLKANKTPTEAYVHPYHSTQFPLYWSTSSLNGFIKEAIGTEPVSPHYESFVRSRRAIFGIAGLSYGLFLAESLNFNSIYGLHGAYQLYTLLAFTILTFEIRYISQKLPAPRLTWFYSAYTENEYQQLVLNWQDSLENAQRKFLSYSKEQIDYYLIHKEYVYIKKRSLSNYLQNEKKNLDKNYYDRTVSMLKTIKSLEDSNVKNKIKEVTESALKDLSEFVSDPKRKEELHKSSFETALKGLSKGEMNYENDIVLPYFVNQFSAKSNALKKLTLEEETAMFALSKDQKKFVVDNDKRAKLDYLSQAPNVSSAGVKNSKEYKAIVERMKARMDSYFTAK